MRDGNDEIVDETVDALEIGCGEEERSRLEENLVGTGVWDALSFGSSHLCFEVPDMGTPHGKFGGILRIVDGEIVS